MKREEGRGERVGDSIVKSEEKKGEKSGFRKKDGEKEECKRIWRQLARNDEK